MRVFQINEAFNMKNTRTISSAITGLLVFSLMVHAQETKETPGANYPSYHTVPKTSFSCSEQKYIPGFYADMETDCKVFHFCEGNHRESFLCPDGMTFNQATLACDSLDNSNCSLSPLFYGVNSGPQIENARRNIFKALNFRSRSRNRVSIRTSDVYEKISSLYDNCLSEEQCAEQSELNDKISHEQEIPKETEENKENEPQFEKLDDSVQNDGFESAAYSRISSEEESDDMEPEIFYDPVTEYYYVNADDMSDQFNGYNHEGFGKKYGITYNEYVDEVPSDVSEESANSPKEFNEVNDIDETREMEFGSQNSRQPARRVRRKPTYVVVQDDYEVADSGAGRSFKFPIEYADQFTTESILSHTDGNFELPDDISERDIPEQADSEVPFEISESLYQNDEPPKTTLNAEEFDRELISQLNLLGIREYDPSEPFPIEEEQLDRESMNDGADVYQTDNLYSFSENMTPDDYESYSTDNEDYSVVVGEQESDQGNQGNEENWYQADESYPVEDLKESDDTYVVIPDEYDSGVLGQDAKTNYQTETLNTEGHIADNLDSYWRNSFYQRYISPGAYPPVEPYWFSPSQYYIPNEYRMQLPVANVFNSQFSQSQEYAHTDVQNDQQFEHNFVNYNSPNEFYPLDDSSSYSYDPSTSFEGHMYDYEHNYPYANVYRSPYVNYGYDSSEETDGTGYSILNENADNTDSDYSASEIQSLIQNYSSEGPEEENMYVTESSLATEEAIADLYATMSSDGLNAIPSEIVDASSAAVNQPEEFYLFNFDEDIEEQANSDGTSGVSGNVEQLNPKELFQTEESRLNSSKEDSKDMKVGSESEFRASNRISGNEDYDQETVNPVEDAADTFSKINSRLFETADNIHFNVDSLYPSSALGNFAAMNAEKASRPDVGNVHHFSDSKSLKNKMYPKSDFQSKGNVMGQQQFNVDRFSTASSTENDFLPRAGESGLPTISKLSEIQERIRSLKTGKFGAFKKYINSEQKN